LIDLLRIAKPVPPPQKKNNANEKYTRKKGSHDDCLSRRVGGRAGFNDSIKGMVIFTYCILAT
jgi:hypothetical protein